MLAFRRHFIGVSAGVLITFGYGLPTNSQVLPTPAEIETPAEPGNNPVEVVPTQEPVPNQEGSALENINPSSNPLLFPTQPNEVEVTTDQPITLDQAIQLARKNNQELQVARLQLERARASLREALAERYPTLSTQLDLSRADSATGEIQNEAQAEANEAEAERLGVSVDDLDLPDDSTVSSALEGTLSLSYDVYTGGRRPAQIRSAEEQVRFQQLDVEQISEQIRFDVSSDYYDLQQADARVGIEQAAVEEATQSLRDAELLEQAGLGTRFAVLQAQVELSAANQRLVRSIADQRISSRQLAATLGLGQQTGISAADEIELAGSWDISLPETIILAYQNRAELQQQLVQRNINEQQRRIALAAVRPQVSVFANYNLLEVLTDDFGLADGVTLGARMQWTLYDGGAARARAEQESVDIAISETQFDNQRNAVRFDVENAYYNLEANQENIQTAAVAVQLAEESLRLARLRFQAGVGTQTDVIQAQSDLTAARGDLLTAIINYNLSLAALQRAVTNLPDNLLFDIP